MTHGRPAGSCVVSMLRGTTLVPRRDSLCRERCAGCGHCASSWSAVEWLARDEAALLGRRLQLAKAPDLLLQRLGVADRVAALAADAVGVARRAHAHEVVVGQLAGQLVQRAGALVEHLVIRPGV